MRSMRSMHTLEPNPNRNLRDFEKYVTLRSHLNNALNGVDNKDDPKKIAGITIPTSDAGWNQMLNKIGKFAKTHHKNALNGKRMTDSCDLLMMRKYINFLSVSKRWCLYTDDHFSNTYRSCRLLNDLQRLNKLI